MWDPQTTNTSTRGCSMCPGGAVRLHAASRAPGAPLRASGMLSEQWETGLEDELVELHLEREQATTSSPGYRPKRPGNPLATELVTSRDVPHGPEAQAAFKPCPSDSDTPKRQRLDMHQRAMELGSWPFQFVSAAVNSAGALPPPPVSQDVSSARIFQHRHGASVPLRPLSLFSPLAVRVAVDDSASVTGAPKPKQVQPPRSSPVRTPGLSQEDSPLREPPQALGALPWGLSLVTALPGRRSAPPLPLCGSSRSPAGGGWSAPGAPSRAHVTHIALASTSARHGVGSQCLSPVAASMESVRGATLTRAEGARFTTPSALHRRSSSRLPGSARARLRPFRWYAHARCRRPSSPCFQTKGPER